MVPGGKGMETKSDDNGSKSSKDFSFFELNKNPNTFSNSFSCTNRSFNEAIAVSTTTRK
jgi:hypothetical protein